MRVMLRDDLIELLELDEQCRREEYAKRQAWSLEERVARGYAIGDLQLSAINAAAKTATFGCPENTARFREGDSLVFMRGGEKFEGKLLDFTRDELTVQAELSPGGGPWLAEEAFTWAVGETVPS